MDRGRYARGLVDVALVLSRSGRPRQGAARGRRIARPRAGLRRGPLLEGVHRLPGSSLSRDPLRRVPDPEQRWRRVLHRVLRAGGGRVPHGDEAVHGADLRPACRSRHHQAGTRATRPGGPGRGKAQARRDAGSLSRSCRRSRRAPSTGSGSSASTSRIRSTGSSFRCRARAASASPMAASSGSPIRAGTAMPTRRSAASSRT